MFWAVNQDGNPIILSKRVSKRILDKIIHGKQFFCPVCGQEVIVRKGTMRPYHFAHRKKTTCANQTGESMYHYYGKKRLYELFHSSYSCQLEPHLSSINQTPDVLIQTNTHSIALEYQCADLHAETWQLRTNGFKTVQLQPFWILGGNRMNRLSKHTIRMKQLEWLSVRKKHTFPYVLFYCPISRLFCIVSILSPFYTTTCLVSFTFIKEKEFSFLLLQKLRPTFSTSHHQEWQKLKKSWRLKSIHYQSIEQSYVHQLFLQASTTLQFTPSFCGIPLPTNVYIQTAPILWQSWLFIKFLSHPIPDVWITHTQVIREFNQLVSNRIFRVRFEKEYSKRAIISYLNYLEKTGVIVQKEAQVFQALPSILWPKSLDQLLKMDNLF